MDKNEGHSCKNCSRLDEDDNFCYAKCEQIDDLESVQGCKYWNEWTGGKKDGISDVDIRNSIQTIRRCQRQNEQLVR